VPAVPGPHSIVPPRQVGGNLDIRDLCAGATLVLPVEVAGALFSIGDTHAAQGDGEVCGTAIESPKVVTLRLELVRGSARAPVAQDQLARERRVVRPLSATRAGLRLAAGEPRAGGEGPHAAERLERDTPGSDRPDHGDGRHCEIAGRAT
jgi:acetamidase/formamidase